MSTIDILIAVDGAKLASAVAANTLQPGTESSPTSLGSYAQSDVYISMIAESENTVDNAGKSELQITASVGDTVRWSMSTFGYNLDYTAYLYNGTFNPATGISSLNYVPTVTTVYLPVTSDPTSAPSKSTNHIYEARGTILEKGQIQYALSFKLIDNATGDVLGYFSWDPFINVS